MESERSDLGMGLETADSRSSGSLSSESWRMDEWTESEVGAGSEEWRAESGSGLLMVECRERVESVDVNRTTFTVT